MRSSYVELYGQIEIKFSSHETWIAFFPIAPHGGFRVFNEFRIVRGFEQQPLGFSKRFNGNHPVENFSRLTSFGNCGSAD